MRIIVGIALLSSLAPCTSFGDQREWSEQQQEIINIVKVWPLEIHEDFDKWADGYHPDWTYWEVGTDNLRTLNEQLDRVRNYIQSGARVLSFEIDPEYVDVRRDMAVIRYDAVETIRESDEETIEVRFSSANVFLKHNDEWKLYSTNIYYPDYPPE